jgi:anti-sigma factor RsiW
VSKLYAHAEALELLPWYVNGTLSDAEHAGVERHIRGCLPCRVALQEQCHLAALLKQQPTVPLSAESGFERLVAEIDAQRQPRRHDIGSRAPRLARFATVAALAASFALAAWLVTLGTDSSPDATFVTATQSGAGAVEIDVVFVAEVSETDKRALIREIGGNVGEPNSIGRYRVRLVDRDADRAEEIIAHLRSDARVRFAARAYSSEQQP